MVASCARRTSIPVYTLFIDGAIGPEVHPGFIDFSDPASFSGGGEVAGAVEDAKTLKMA